jgi:lipoprotein-releasing system ATP-binding protein
VLRCKDVYRRFDAAGEPLEVLRGVTFEVSPAQVVAILGPSGSGKSTLLHLLGGLDRPTAGEIFWDDVPLSTLNQFVLAEKRTHFVGLIFQSHYLLEDLTVQENVSLPGRIAGTLDKKRADVLLEHVGLSNRAKAFPKTLSGGERQRVAVARALYSKPAVILADEPTGSLDRHNAQAVYELLVDLARSEGSAVVMVTHDEGLVRDVDVRFALHDGVLTDVATHTDAAAR